MSYAHIENLYRATAQDILLFKQCYAMEKIHGTSSHIDWKNETKQLSFFSGGENHENFVKLFDQEKLTALFTQLVSAPTKHVRIHGEAYGDKQQGMSKVYGPKLRFVAFDVCIDNLWLSVSDADAFVKSFDLEFVFYRICGTDLASLDAERDSTSEQSIRNGIVDNTTYDSSKREGIVIRPLIEVCKNNGNRICAKHKRAEFCERKTPQIVDINKREILIKAAAIANEWVTEMRLSHVLDKLGNPTDMSDIPKVIVAMIEDVTREASGEIFDSKDARKAISAATVKMYKERVTKIPNL